MPSLNVAESNQQVQDLLRAGRLREAEALCREILTHAPDDPIALHNLGVLATTAGKFEAAAELFGRAILFAPAVAQFHLSRSLPLIHLGRRADAIDSMREAIRLDPNLAAAHSNLGVLLSQEGKHEEAERALLRAIELRPGEAGAYANLANAVRAAGRIDEAIQWNRKAIQINPRFAHAYNSLGSCLRESGRPSEAVAAFRQAIDIDPSLREAHDNLVYVMHFDPATSSDELMAEHLRWSAKLAEPLRATWTTHANDRTTGRRLRIGYVSPDLRNHVVGLFMGPILGHHNRREFEVYCYADVPDPDEVTERLKRYTDVWRDTTRLSDQQLAQQIREDRIDILIDLTLHMRGNRLLAFARKPAPVQLTHLAYCGTSGMSAMDYCIADPHLCPPGTNETFFTEKLLRLPECYWCYRPAPDAPPIGPLPALTRGHITFGSLNSFAKVNDPLIQTWSQILRTVPDSRLLVHAPGGELNRSVRERFIAAGIAPDRLSLHGSLPLFDYLNLYNTIDIALDPFPYAGGTTSLDALWMGVPIVTLAGQLPVSRAGVTLLKNLGMEQWIAASEQEYVRKAIDFASDLNRLAEIRHSLRERLAQSPLMNAIQYVRGLESLYHQAWSHGCANVTRKSP